MSEDTYTIKDSGARQDFGTGSVRDSQEGKGRYDLLPLFALKALALHFQKGSLKYGDRNWEKGQPISRYLDSAERHTLEFMLGNTDENHLIAACWNLMAAYDTTQRIKQGLLPEELDDLPYPLKEAKAVRAKADVVLVREDSPYLLPFSYDVPPTHDNPSGTRINKGPGLSTLRNSILFGAHAEEILDE